MRLRSALLIASMAALAFACRSSSATDGSAAAGSAAPRGKGEAAPPRTSFERGRVLVPGGKAFEVEVVQDPASRERGLQHRKGLAADRGMLFIFPAPARHRFWMFECEIPLDIVWLDASRTVVHVGENLPICARQPCPDYGPDTDDLYVLEVGAGIARQAGIAPGTRLTLLFDHPPNPS